MPDEYVHEEPLDEEERQLAKELEAGEWVSDPNSVITDTFVETISALEATADELERARSDPYRWKWVTLTLHSAVQGMMVLALEDGNGLNVLRPADTKRWLKAYEDNTLGREMAGKPFSMDTFLGLYKKIKDDKIMRLFINSQKFTPQGTQEQSIKCLNRFRNQYIHFPAHTYILRLEGLPEMIIDCLNVARFLAYDSKNINWPEELVGRMEKAFKAAAKAAQEIKAAYALPPQL